MRGILFITRKRSGIGGMERLSDDLWALVHSSFAEAKRIRPFYSRDVTFPLRAFAAGVRASMRGDVIYLADAALAPLGYILAKVFRGKVTLTAHGLDVVWPSRLYQAMLRFCLPSIRSIHAVSRATADEVCLRGVPPERVTVLPPGSSVRGVREKSPPRPLRLLSVGRLIPRKGIVWFLREVYPFLCREFPELRYDIVGEGEHKKLIKKIVQERALTNVFVHGAIHAECLDGLFLRSHVLVMPNVPVRGDMEGFGVVCIEAALRGVPTVAAQFEGLSDSVIAGGTGAHFTPLDPQGCSDEVLRMLRNPIDPKRAAQCARRRFSWEVLFPFYKDALFS